MSGLTSKGRLRLATGAITLLISSGYLIGAGQYSVGNLAQPGAAVFPIIVGILLAGVSIFTMFDGYRMRSQPVTDPPTPEGRSRVLRFGALIVVYVIALVLLGTIVSGAILAAGVMRLLSDRKWIYIAAWSIAMAVAIHLIFAVALGIPLPRGIVWPR